MLNDILDGDSVTWYEPPPVQTSSDPAVFHTANQQLREGSTNAALNWNFSLTQDLNLIVVTIKFNEVPIATLVPSGPAAPASGYEGRFNVSWISQSATLVIFNVTDDDTGLFSCELNTFQGATNKVWKRKIQVKVVGKHRH